ncbi:TlpA family protein disulfide reductase [Echinicola strongylocentroti]|uniref:TlpA family protein disulfide reductase n=1 Tax=Echinicola strongylocentroti TaxID=1795355 RepID=A0A2Z4IFK8_9BACT|nr:TlpA disulfide reductase family protein [Echinicola strongylocentroti]AWW29278.1 TlpA family protein disulfide reductase [Echinicola strongylocentroti]
MNWKKEVKSWGAILAVFVFVYAMGWYAPIVGKIQSIILSTGLIKPDIEQQNEVGKNFDYSAKFTDLDGHLVDLQNYRNKTVFINLWATWCPPCRAEMPHIASLYEKLKDEKDIAFLMVSLDKDAEKPKEYIKGQGFAFPVAHASYGLNASLKHSSIPTTLVIGPDGKILFRQEGMSNFDTEEFREFLKGQQVADL